MSAPAQTLVAIATYNELGTLPSLVEEVFRALPDAHILVVDDNSPDGTGRWCDQRAAEDPRLRCLHRSGKLGLGTALVKAMQHAVEHGYRYLVTMDADFSHPPERLADLLGGMGSPDRPAADVMIGSRYTPGGRIEGWPWGRHMMSRAVNFLSRWVLGLSPKDCSSGYRCYRTDLLARLDFAAIHSFGYSFEEEVLWRLKRLGATFGEVPIAFVNRRQGTSKVNLRELLSSAWVLVRLAAGNLFRR